MQLLHGQNMYPQDSMLSWKHLLLLARLAVLKASHHHHPAALADANGGLGLHPLLLMGPTGDLKPEFTLRTSQPLLAAHTFTEELHSTCLCNLFCLAGLETNLTTRLTTHAINTQVEMKTHGG